MKFMIVILLLSLLAWPGSLSMRIKGGWSFGIAKQMMGYDTTISTSGFFPTFDFKQIFVSFGKGVPAELEMVYRFPSGFSVTVGSGYYSGLRQQYNNIDIDEQVATGLDIKMQNSGRVAYIPLNAGVEMSGNSRIKGRFGAGISIALMPFMWTQNKQEGELSALITNLVPIPMTGDSMAGMSEYEGRVHFKPGMGFYADAGLDFELSSRLTLGTGIKAVLMNLISKKTVIKEPDGSKTEIEHKEDLDLFSLGGSGNIALEDRIPVHSLFIYLNMQINF